MCLGGPESKIGPPGCIIINSNGKESKEAAGLRDSYYAGCNNSMPW